MLLQDSGITLIGGRLDFRGEGGDGESVGGIEGTTKEEALPMRQGDDSGRMIAIISCGNLVGEGGEKVMFTVDLFIIRKAVVSRHTSVRSL